MNNEVRNTITPQDAFAQELRNLINEGDTQDRDQCAVYIPKHEIKDLTVGHFNHIHCPGKMLVEIYITSIETRGMWALPEEDRHALGVTTMRTQRELFGSAITRIPLTPESAEYSDMLTGLIVKFEVISIIRY